MNVFYHAFDINFAEVITYVLAVVVAVLFVMELGRRFGAKVRYHKIVKKDGYRDIKVEVTRAYLPEEKTVRLVIASNFYDRLIGAICAVIFTYIAIKNFGHGVLQVLDNSLSASDSAAWSIIVLPIVFAALAGIIYTATSYSFHKGKMVCYAGLRKKYARKGCRIRRIQRLSPIEVIERRRMAAENAENAKAQSIAKAGY